MRLARQQLNWVLGLIICWKDDYFRGGHENVINSHILCAVPIRDLHFSFDHFQLHLLIYYNSFWCNFDVLKEKGKPFRVLIQLFNVLSFDILKKLAFVRCWMSIPSDWINCEEVRAQVRVLFIKKVSKNALKAKVILVVMLKCDFFKHTIHDLNLFFLFNLVDWQFDR